MNMERAGDDDSIDVVHVEQAAVVVEGLNAGTLLFAWSRRRL